MSALKRIKPENYSTFKTINIEKLVKVIKKRNFILANNITVGGDAPKDFIKVYIYGQAKRSQKQKWVKYIAKAGHKWYPNESITEHLLNCIGKELGLFMSHSELAMISGQLRFLSKYFLDTKRQELVHGVDIFAGYVSNRVWVEEIENNNLARTFFTFQFATKAIEFTFPNEHKELIDDFVRLLVFDAIVGNNDRHFYNWGVVKYIKNDKKSYFSPIFDTARGLFWNDSDEKIANRVGQEAQLESYLRKYIKNSFPKIGWEEEKNLNHIELIDKIRQLNSHYVVIIEDLLSRDKEEKVMSMINTQFRDLLSPERLRIINQCLKLRFSLLRN